MYNIKGPSKIVAKTRRGLSQQSIDNYRDYNKKNDVESEKDNPNVPKPVFHKKTSPVNNRHEEITPQHEEVINFVQESWKSVYMELEQESSRPKGQQRIYYYEDEPSDNLQHFKPFDLESWWGKRLYAYITNSVSGKQ